MHKIKPQSFESRRNSSSCFFTRGGYVSCLRACLGARLLLQSPERFGGALTASLDSCAETKSASSVAQLNLAEFGGRCRKAMLGVCCKPTLILNDVWQDPRSSDCVADRLTECSEESGDPGRVGVRGQGSSCDPVRHA